MKDSIVTLINYYHIGMHACFLLSGVLCFLAEYSEAAFSQAVEGTMVSGSDSSCMGLLSPELFPSLLNLTLLGFICQGAEVVI